MSPQTSAEYFFEVTFLSIIVFFGIISNALSFAVFSRKTFEKISLNFLFRIMCITDALSVLLALQTVFAYADVYNIRIESIFCCKFFVYTTYWLLSVKGWLLVLIGLERLEFIILCIFEYFQSIY